MAKAAENKLFQIIITILIFALTIIFVLPVFYSQFICVSKQPEIATTNLTFNGLAKGGTLLLGEYSIETTKGENAESIIRRLAEKIGSSDEVGNVHFGKPVREAIPDFTTGNTIKLPGLPEFWSLAGTETGLGIPETPMSLSCTYNQALDKHQINWENPKSLTENDLIYLKWKYQLFPNEQCFSRTVRGFSYQGIKINGAVFLPATIKSHTIDDPLNVRNYFKLMNSVYIDVSIMVLRFEKPVHGLLEKGITPTDSPYRNNNTLSENVIPSNIASIRVLDKGMTQEDSLVNPYTGNIATNWAAWSTDTNVEKEAFGQGREINSCYQIITSPANNHSHGIYRKFLGLTPGHTYRITARLSTLDMYSTKSDWSFSLHAKAGNSAITVASFGPGKTVDKNFRDFSNEQIRKFLDNAIIESDITLPLDIDEITVWWRFNCNDPEGKVGVSGIKICDITDKGTFK